ncbi:MAG TPA: heparin lyase I family protein [Polyangiaceae bacterium]|nr:heparin lyase I family protein [Polyangiaceae bacterium]
MRGVTGVGSLSILLALPVLGACAPKVSAGEWECPAERGPDGGVIEPPAKTDPVTVPWSTGFEEGFCAYPSLDGAGFCYGDGPYLLVSEPHRPGGHQAAEFKVVGGDWNQTRCVRQGAFPDSAYYGAWYYIPEALEDAPNWNLWHFQGGDAPAPRLRDLWDVTLSEIAQSGEWELVVKDYLVAAPDVTVYTGADHKPIPIGKWFHIELFLKRAADSTGKLALYQDGVLLFEKANLKSDLSPFTQWYVGDWAEKATPANSSLFVDDVSISTMLSSTSATL